MAETFSQGQLEAIAGALGDTETGLKGTEIGMLIAACQMVDPGEMTKRHRIYNAFAESQNARQDRTRILGFIRKAMSPDRYSREPHRYEPMRANLNQALAFAGLVVTEAGKIETAERATTLPEAQRRAKELRTDLETRGVHADVLRFCRAELLADDYFHAVQEAVKSVGEKLRAKTGLTDDGGTLVDRVLGAIRRCSRSTRAERRASVASRAGSPTSSKASSGCSVTRPPTKRASIGQWAKRMRRIF